MNQPQMVPYNPLQGQPYIPPQKEKAFSKYRFEHMPLHVKLIGIFVVLPLYFYLLPAKILPLFADQLASALGVTMDFASYSLYYNLLFQICNVLILLILMRNVLRQSFADVKKHTFVYFLVWVILSYFAFFIANIAAGLIEQLVLGVEGTAQNQEAVIEMAEVSAPLMILLAGILGPIAEELIFRGIIFRTIRPLGKIPAILISSLLFGFVHVADYVLAGDYKELIYVISYVVMGISLGIIYELRKNMLVNICVHMIQNTFSIIIITLFWPFL